jgi:hypothetical protein
MLVRKKQNGEIMAKRIDYMNYPYTVKRYCNGTGKPVYKFSNSQTVKLTNIDYASIPTEEEREFFKTLEGKIYKVLEFEEIAGTMQYTLFAKHKIYEGHVIVLNSEIEFI